MHRDPLKQLLAQYGAKYPEEAITSDFNQFVREYQNCFDRSLAVGHVTGSAWIIDPQKRKALLLHHKKLNLWLQPGGHCDGDSDVAKVAGKEAQEETGISKFNLFDKEIFDLDIHKIPAWKDIPEHLHYDARFLIHADCSQAIQLSEESNDLRWFDLGELNTVSTDYSVLRLAEKVQNSGN